MVVTQKSDLGSLTTPNFGQKLITVVAAATPQKLQGADLFCRRVVMYGRSAYRVDNTSSVWVGVSGENGEQPIEVAAGGETEIVAPPGCKLNLKNWWIESETNGDGVVIVYDKD